MTNSGTTSTGGYTCSLCGTYVPYGAAHICTEHNHNDTGWICPKCGKVNAPWKPSCDCVEAVNPWQPVYPQPYPYWHYYYHYYPYRLGDTWPYYYHYPYRLGDPWPYSMDVTWTTSNNSWNITQ